MLRRDGTLPDGRHYATSLGERPYQAALAEVSRSQRSEVLRSVTSHRYLWNVTRPDDDPPNVWGPDSHKTPEMRLRQEMLSEIGRLHGEYLRSTEDVPPAPEYRDGALWHGIITGPPEAEYEFTRKADEVVARYDKLLAEMKRRRVAGELEAGESAADGAEGVRDDT